MEVVWVQNSMYLQQCLRILISGPITPVEVYQLISNLIAANHMEVDCAPLIIEWLHVQITNDDTRISELDQVQPVASDNWRELILQNFPELQTYASAAQDNSSQERQRLKKKWRNGEGTFTSIWISESKSSNFSTKLQKTFSNLYGET